MKRMKRVTIYDVANHAGVSLATVSRVINGSDVVRGNTRQKVEEAIEKLGYKPNAIAQGLALSKTTSIALVIPEASFTYTGQVINGLLDVAKIDKYNVMLHTTTEGIAEISDIIENIIKSRVDGVIIYNDRLTQSEINELSKYNIPIVIIGNRISDKKISSVFVDIEQAVYELVSDYLEKGKKDIVILEDRKNNNACRLMKNGAARAFKEAGLEFDGFLTIPEEYRSTYKFTREYMKNHKHELMLAYRDSQSFAIINAAQENGIKVPDEMEVVCILDTKYNSMMRPEISSFAIPSYDLGSVSMRVMTKMLNNEEEENGKEIELSYLYTPRSSTK